MKKVKCSVEKVCINKGEYYCNNCPRNLNRMYVIKDSFQLTVSRQGDIMDIGDKVIDKNGYKGVITNIFVETGQVQVQQKPNVWCTYDNEGQLRKID